MSAIMINNINVEFEVTQNEVFATSLQVAEVFGKRHADILRAIEALPQDDFNERNFALVEYTDKKGEARPYYKMTRDGFSMLVMGFTGERAYQWKVEFIKAFNLLLDEVRALHTPKTLSEALFLAAKQAQEIEELSDSLNEAVKTKAWLGSKREATAMATASAAKRENARLKVELDKSKEWASIKKVAGELGVMENKFRYADLRRKSNELGLDRPKIKDKNYPDGIRLYHKDVWAAVYDIDITKF